MFVKLVRKCRERERDRAAACFRRFDEENVGVLDDVSQLRALVWLDCVDRRGIALERTDSERQGVDLRGFLDMVSRFKTNGLHTIHESEGFTDLEVAELEASFRRFDADGNGDISRRELARLVEVLFPAYAHSAEERPHLARLVAEIDIDGSGSLDFLEFIKLMRKIHEQEEHKQLVRELETTAEHGFSLQDVNDFRGIFLEADEDGACRLSLDVLRALLVRACGLRARDDLNLSLFFDQAIVRRGVEGDEHGVFNPGQRDQVDFCEFLYIMRKLVNAGIATSSPSTR
jgi:Ca2+-binding EF-hand superfamily protein